MEMNKASHTHAKAENGLEQCRNAEMKKVIIHENSRINVLGMSTSTKGSTRAHWEEEGRRVGWLRGRGGGGNGRNEMGTFGHDKELPNMPLSSKICFVQ